MTNQPSDGLPNGLIAYDSALEDEIFEFQREAYPERVPELIASRWRWMFSGSAERLEVSPMFWVYRSKGKILAQQGAIAIKVKIHEEERVTGWFVETIAAANVRGGAVGPMVVRKALEDLPFNLSLGQTPQMRKLQYALGWREVFPLSTYVLALRPIKIVRQKFNIPIVRELAALGLFMRQRMARVFSHTSNLGEWSVREITRFGSEHDRLWRLSAKEYGCAVVRDASYLNWKYVDQPGMQFIRLELIHRDKLRAVATLMLTEPGEVYRYRRGFIVDLVVPSSDIEAVSILLANCVSELEARAAELIVFYLGNRALERLVQRFGFIRREARHVLLVAMGDLSDRDRDSVLAGDEWLITMGDSDVDQWV